MKGTFTAVTALVFGVAMMQPAQADPLTEALTDLANGPVKQWLNNSTVTSAIKAQNSKHSGISQDKINELDQQWRAETSASSKPMIDSVLATDLSQYLKGVKDESAGMFTEIFVMDNVGLNVGQSDATSDYWQGDEAKWQQTYQVGADAIHISEVELDESSQQLQVQLSLPISEGGSVIGAVTIGVNVDAL